MLLHGTIVELCCQTVIQQDNEQKLVHYILNRQQEAHLGSIAEMREMFLRGFATTEQPWTPVEKNCCICLCLAGFRGQVHGGLKSFRHASSFFSSNKATK
ncbi:hypothetical protein IRJ41_010216 [Triplophysa rosa]|uniref:Uncharacterized protein n=1 Tax=Triplophysa rosa TaxID=992332 RepID=A0A9W7WCF8_TRIRA|nr:hypothetical protein IRJ41_010216 [Triplophysa rosa]